MCLQLFEKEIQQIQVQTLQSIQPVSPHRQTQKTLRVIGGHPSGDVILLLKPLSRDQCSKYPRYNPDIAPILCSRHLAAMIWHIQTDIAFFIQNRQ